MRTRTVKAAVGAAAFSLVFLTACGGGDDSGDGGDNTSAADDNDNDDGDDNASPSGPNVGTGAKTAVKAMDTAAGDVDDGAVLSADLDDNGERWEVSVASGTKAEYELMVSGDGTKVESNNKDNDLDEDLTRLGDAKLSAQDAAERAAKDHSGDVTGVDLDNDGGTLTWQVTLNDGGKSTEYRLDADSGKTLGSEADD